VSTVISAASPARVSGNYCTATASAEEKHC
jgi:hypothetical protein